MQTKIKPKISIVVPVYKSEKFLHQCLDSLLKQTLKEIEIILVNDGSPDNSDKICDDYALADDRVIVIHQKNKGAAHALNIGTEKASAPYLMYLDADDWLENNTCELSYQTVISLNLDVVFWSYFREGQTKSIKDIPIFKEDILFDEGNIKNLQRRLVGLVDEELSNPIRTDAISAGWGKLYRSKIIKDNEIKWTDTQLVGSSDVLFSIQLFQYVKRAYFLNEHLNHYRMYNPHSLTKNYSFSLFNKLSNLFSLISKHIENNKLEKDFITALENRISLSLINNVLSIVSLRKSVTTNNKINHLKYILNDPVFKKAVNNLKLNYLPLHWKLFFLYAKRKNVWFTYFLGVLMNKLR